jgi:hypothetical protein
MTKIKYKKILVVDPGSEKQGCFSEAKIFRST